MTHSLPLQILSWATIWNVPGIQRIIRYIVFKPRRLMLLGKAYIHQFSPQLWVNSWINWALGNVALVREENMDSDQLYYILNLKFVESFSKRGDWENLNSFHKYLVSNFPIQFEYFVKPINQSNILDRNMNESEPVA